MSPRETEPTTASDDSEHSSMTISTIKQQQERRVRVSFGSVQVREYERVVGDHPECKVGPPMSLGWDYEEQSPQTLDDFENISLPLHRSNLRLSSITRKNMLHNVYGIPEEEIRKAEAENQKIQKSREKTRKESKGTTRRQEFVQSARRKFRRRFSRENLFTNMNAGLMMFPSMMPVQ